MFILRINGKYYLQTLQCLQYLHIYNILELKAVFFGLKALCGTAKNNHILIRIDNTSAVAAIYKMGSTKSIDLDIVAQTIWIGQYLENCG